MYYVVSVPYIVDGISTNDVHFVTDRYDIAFDYLSNIKAHPAYKHHIIWIEEGNNIEIELLEKWAIEQESPRSVGNLDLPY